MNLEKTIVAKDLIDRLLKASDTPYRNFLIWGERTYDTKKTLADIGKDYGLSQERVRQIVRRINQVLNKKLKEIAWHYFNSCYYNSIVIRNREKEKNMRQELLKNLTDLYEKYNATLAGQFDADLDYIEKEMTVVATKLGMTVVDAYELVDNKFHQQVIGL